jgi:uncharacterized membrane protein
MAERIGRVIFALAIIAIGIESIVCAHAAVAFVKGSQVVPIIPYLPAIWWLSILFGFFLVACGVLMLRARTTRLGAIAFAAAFVVSGLIFDLPRAIAHLGNMPLRTLVLQTFMMAALALMLPAAKLPNDWRMMLARYCIAVSLIVFGVDHFLALSPISTLVPKWMPFPIFWVVFFGVSFIAAGVSFALNILRGWAAVGMALMFALFDLTLHIPRTLGAYNVPGAIRDPDEWCGIFIVAAFCGGLLALADLRKGLLS